MKAAEGPVPCLCGHDHLAHRHYRPRSECSLCECPRWRPKRGLRRLAVLVLDRLSKLSAKPGEAIAPITIGSAWNEVITGGTRRGCGGRTGLPGPSHVRCRHRAPAGPAPPQDHRDVAEAPGGDEGDQMTCQDWHTARAITDRQLPSFAVRAIVIPFGRVWQ